jgi:hypothetical protein
MQERRAAFGRPAVVSGGENAGLGASSCMLTSILLMTVTLPFTQWWSDTGLISRDDDWSAVSGVVGYRGDGLTSAPGADPRAVVSDGSGAPADVNANEADPRAVGLAAGVTEFELPDPVVALQGSATAAAPHLVMSVDTRGRSGVTVRYRLRDVDPSSIANAVQPVALQFRVGTNGDFVAVPGGFVADATTGPGEATLVTPVSAPLPAAADDKPLVQLRIVTTNAVGQDEWVGVDDIEVEANGSACGPPGPVWPPPPFPTPPSPPGSPSPPVPPAAPPALTGLTISPATFPAARRGPAVTKSGRTGTSLRFRLSRAADVEFRVTSLRLPGPPRARIGRVEPMATSGPRARTPVVSRELGRFSVPGRRGVNRFRFMGRLRGRALRGGSYRLWARAIDRDGLASTQTSLEFRIR